MPILGKDTGRSIGLEEVALPIRIGIGLARVPRSCWTDPRCNATGIELRWQDRSGRMAAGQPLRMTRMAPTMERCNTLLIRLGALAILLPGSGAPCVLGAAQDQRSEPEIQADVASLVEQLSDPSYDRRMAATRKLCAAGQPALPSLRRVAEGSDREAALRARKIIQALERILFAGVEVRLESDRNSLGWDEPAQVRLIFENKSRFPARLPFPASSGQSEGDSGDARQVGMMIDASDWLLVTNSAGREVELRVDDIADDPEVLRVVQERLQGGPVTELTPGDRMVIVLDQFNRGWARYPMLDAGEYRVTMRYVPEWSDPVLAEQKIGEVRSNELMLRVERGAPETVSRAGAKAEVAVRRENDEFVATITNRNDQSILVNTNYGVSAPFAEILWVYERDGRRETMSAASSTGRTWSDFDTVRFRKVDAGSSLELARIGVADLATRMGDAGKGVQAGEGLIAFSYFNLCDKNWQIREQANLDRDAETPAALRSPLPRQLLSTRLTSSSVRLAGMP